MNRTLTLTIAILVSTACTMTMQQQPQTTDEKRTLSTAAVEQLDDLMSKNETDAYLVLAEESIIYESGATAGRFNAASVRKSLISGLFGIAASRGLIDLESTLADLNIDEPNSPLTDSERRATVRDLLQARSGIYLPSIGESRGMVERRPTRGAFLPGEHFYYNNWDFNALGTIFEQETGLTIGQAFYDWVAVPTSMQDFRISDVKYQQADFTSHRMYRFYISARDLSRFGSLYINDGRWGNNRVLPAGWAKESLAKVSEVDYTPHYDGYAYLWWIDSENQIVWADGSGGQLIGLDFQNNIVVVARNNTGRNFIGRLWYQWFSTFAPPEEGYELLNATRAGL